MILAEHMHLIAQRSTDRIISSLTDGHQPGSGAVLVLVGFPPDVYSSAVLDQYRLFSKVADCLDLSTLVGSRKVMVQELASTSAKPWPCWCTYEEYLASSPETFALFRTPRFLTSGLYYRAFPLAYGLGGWNAYLAKLCAEPEELDGVAPPPREVQEAFEAVFSSLVEVDGVWYASYASLPKETDEIFTDTLSLPPLNEGSFCSFSLGGDEADLLRVISAAGDPNHEEVSVYVEDRLTPPEYQKRIGRLQAVAGDRCHISVLKRPPTAHPLRRYPQIGSILQDLWQYTSFRNLRIYKDLGSYPLDKSTVDVSQSEIIETIIEQAENAAMGRSYRDIFVTAPTGSGKSLLFQVPAVYLARTYGLMTIVISPLIGLMNDQVENLYLKHVDCAATINSGIAPAIRDEIQSRIENRQVSILYVSPETLLSRSDISTLIGSRKIGLFVVDEAHIVTTWGKAFRSDYWYLGTYLQKLRRANPCVVATFTATAIYGGVEDMFIETRDSLNMVNPKTYFGYVPRQNIETCIQNQLDYRGKGHEYLRDKFGILLERLKEFSTRGVKTLVYFPMVKMIQQFIDFCNSNGEDRLTARLGRYFGPLEASAKEDAYRRFRSGDCMVMLATKAFGMGIDIPDIGAIYHFAPTGNVCDYVQEIGRAARQLPTGQAVLDYLPGDFAHVNRLHGISTLTKQQLIGTLKKVLEISKSEGGKRRLLIRSDDFRYLFATSVNTEDEEVDNKLKTALLILEKDFVNRLGYAAILARPRQLFTVEYYSAPRETVFQLPKQVAKHCSLESDLSRCVSTDVYRVDLKSIWKSEFPNLSFAQFKYYFRSQPDALSLPALRAFSPILVLSSRLGDTVAKTRDRLSTLVEAINATFVKFVNPNKRFTPAEFGAALPDMNGYSRAQVRLLGRAILQSAYVYCSLMKRSHIHYQWFLQWDRDEDEYQIKSPSYQDYGNWLRSQFGRLSSHARLHSGALTLAVDRANKIDLLNWYTFLGALEEFGFATFSSQGGENPEIFVRINSPLVLQQAVDRPDRYRNIILENVQMRHRLSVAMLHYLFTQRKDTIPFWEAIEDYFLGNIPDSVLAEASNSKA